jgi:hypothetical protein
MSDTKKYPKWKRSLWLVFKVYCCLCALLVTVCLVLVGFEISSSQTSYSSHGYTENDVLTQYGTYMAKEYPKRGDNWCDLANVLGSYAQKTNVTKDDAIKYLGAPDLVTGKTTNSLGFIYFLGPSGNSNVSIVSAHITNGSFRFIGYNSVTSNELSKLKPFKLSEQASESDQ